MVCRAKISSHKKCPKTLKTGSFAPWAQPGLCPRPRPSLLAPLSTNLRSPSDMYLKLSCMPEKRESYTVFVPGVSTCFGVPAARWLTLGFNHCYNRVGGHIVTLNMKLLCLQCLSTMLSESMLTCRSCVPALTKHATFKFITIYIF